VSRHLRRLGHGEAPREQDVTELQDQFDASTGHIHDGTANEGPLLSSKIKWTPEGGMAIKLTNKTGGVTVKGYLVHPYSAAAVDNAVALVPVGGPDIIGAFYEDGVADGAEAWIVVAGIADVYFGTDTTRGHFARMSISADTGDAPGVATSEAVPSSPFATDKHFQEIGHVLESRVGAGLAKVALHFN
jgi:hypothetical protein